MASGSWRWVNFPAQKLRGGPLMPFRDLATGYIFVVIPSDFAQSLAKEAGDQRKVAARARRAF
jgi:hypothetical protein